MGLTIAVRDIIMISHKQILLERELVTCQESSTQMKKSELETLKK